MIYDTPLARQIYRRSPVPAQNLLMTLYGAVRRLEQFSPAFRRYQAELERTQWLSPGELRSRQTERLQRLIRHAYENVPYYRRAFDDRKLKPADIRSAEDLYKLPVLTKEAIRLHGPLLRARNVPARRTTLCQTGGTTGQPLMILLDKEQLVFEHAVRQRHHSWAGCRFGQRSVDLRTFYYEIPPDAPPAEFWRRDWIGNQLFLSGYHLSRETLPRYLEKLQQWQPVYLRGAPASLFTLARYMESQGVQFPVRAVFPSSELLTSRERAVIERQFACKAWDYYGASERAAFGQQCEHGNYHQNVEYGLMQVDAPRGTPAPAGEKGELILTGLANFSMPLIRYAIEDIGSLIDEDCPCGRGLPRMGKVEGRRYDALVTGRGTLTPASGLDRFYASVERVERCQLIQRKAGEVTVRALPLPGFTQADAAELKRQLQLRVGEETQIRVEVVDELPLTMSGKARFVVSEVDLDQVLGLQ